MHVAAQRAISNALNFPVDDNRRKSIARKLRALGLEGKPWVESLEDLDRLLTQHLDACQESALSDWKNRVRAWCVNEKDIYRFMRNNPPAKCVCIRDEHERVLTDPLEVFANLHAYWSSIENWDSQLSFNVAAHDLEDQYAMFVPHVPAKIAVDAKLLQNTIKDMRPSSPGLDGWTVAEMKQLPEDALASLLLILRDSPSGLGSSLVALVKRIPVEKEAISRHDAPSADKIRPIDIFSVVFRAISSAQTNSLRWWKALVLHPGQYATGGGALAALGRINHWVETAKSRTRPVWALSIDFAKLFNSICPHLAARTLVVMGLDQKSARELIEPIVQAKLVWRLAHNAVVPQVQNSRGVPQGLSASVLLAEAFLALLIWKIANLPGLEVVAYIDDVNCFAPSRELLEKTIDMVKQFEATFRLSISPQKCKLWGTDEVGLWNLSERTGFPVEKCVKILGANWNLGRRDAEDSLEDDRVQKSLYRLTRLRHISASLTLKASVISVGALSLLDYVGGETGKWARSLRGPIKVALDLAPGAPEIVYNVLVSSTLDPMLRWILSLLRLWHATWSSPQSRELLSNIRPSSRGTRMAILLAELGKRGITIEEGRLWRGPESVSLASPWAVLRKSALKFLLAASCECLSGRRPAVFGGLSSLGVKSHQRFLKGLSPFSAKVIMRVWAGCPMTLGHKATISGNGEGLCTCGMERQDIPHLLFRCPLLPEPSLAIRSLEAYPPAVQAALILPADANDALIFAWKEACARIISALANPQCNVGPRADPLDLKGHVPFLSSEGTYVFCGLCFISRKLQDQKFLVGAYTWLACVSCALSLPLS